MNKWEKVRLGDVATFVNGFAFKPEYWKNYGLPIIRIQNLNNENATYNYYDKDISDKYIIRTGDVLISWSASLGVFEWNRGTAVLNQHIFKVVFDKINVDKQFFIYAVRRLLGEMGRQTHGSTMKHITKDKFDKVLFPLPPFAVQNRISLTLNTVAELLTKKKQQLSELDNLIKSIFYEFFGDPITNEKSWVVCNLGEICNSIKDGPHASPKYVDEGIPFISVNNIINGYWNLENVKYITREDYEKFSARCKPEYGDVLYTKGGTTGFAKFVDRDFEFMNWVHIAVLKYNREFLNGIFLEKMLNSDYCYAQSQRYTRGIANRDLVLGQMKKIIIFIPPIELQNQFAGIVTKIEEQKAFIKKSIEETQLLFDSLMSQYFD